ncbi:hypothetical protein JB92DRAFT_2745074 [Gautieria morchelliformis]|nr:hypothetical protein JB92DRAFT_2745074 [Gautieria morchelliformis]
MKRRLQQRSSGTSQFLSFLSSLTLCHSYANRSARFIDAYQKGLTDSQAVWANQRYHGHCILPGTILEELAGKKYIFYNPSLHC